MTRRRRGECAFVLALASGAVASPSRAEPAEFRDSEILAPRPPVEVERVQTRITAYEQTGLGYQSQAGPKQGPGSETLHVLQGQGEFVLNQGALTHRVWVPVDLVTSASANAADSYYAAPDVISTASAQNVASQVEYELSVRADAENAWSGGAGVHHEENFVSWLFSFGYERSLADDNATLSVAANQALDWFDWFTLGGKRVGRTSRSSTNVNAGLSQLLSATLVASASYGFTLQVGELSNTWNTVPTAFGERAPEILPRQRLRHALSFGLLQWLPWHAALRGTYRFYGDDWGSRAHSVEAALHQRFGALLIVGATYRYHHQTAVDFFTTRAELGEPFVTADSDLASFGATTLGVSAELTLPTRNFGLLFLSAGYDRYFRSNELRVNVVTWASGFRF